MERVYAWPHFFQGATLTELALEKHWGQLATVPQLAAQPLVDDRGNVTAAGMRARAEEIRRQEDAQISPPADPTPSTGGPGTPVEATASASEAPGQGGGYDPAEMEWREPGEIPVEVWP
jgi:hypothetical protein